jgi:hypothetical protein
MDVFTLTPQLDHIIDSKVIKEEIDTLEVSLKVNLEENSAHPEKNKQEVFNIQNTGPYANDIEAIPDQNKERTFALSNPALNKNFNSEVKATVHSMKVEGNVYKEGETEEKEGSAETETSEEESPLPGLLEQPLIQEGPRHRRSTELFIPTELQNRKDVEVPEGKGEKLGQIAYVAEMIGKTTAADLRLLHRALFGRPGKLRKVKHNIREFCGFDPSSKFEEERAEKILNRATLQELKDMSAVLGLHRSGTKDSVIENILAFLKEPNIDSVQIKITPKKKSPAKSNKRSFKNNSEKMKKRNFNSSYEESNKAMKSEKQSFIGHDPEITESEDEQQPPTGFITGDAPSSEEPVLENGESIISEEVVLEHLKTHEEEFLKGSVKVNEQNGLT